MLICIIMLLCYGCTSGANTPDNPADAGSTGTVSGSDTGTGSNTVTPAAEPEFNVTFITDSDKYEISGSDTISVKRGESAVFVLNMKENYKLDKVIRNGADLEADIVNENGKATVTIKDVRYSFAIEAECVMTGTFIAYHPNGGSYVNGDDPEKPYIVGYSLKNRLRPNTETGVGKLIRKNWVMTGWNTEPDGTGEHIGLGSRVTVEENGMINLYAEWIRQSNTSDFEFIKRDDGYAIRKYLGNAETVVLPEEYNGEAVTAVLEDAFAEHTEIKKAVISPSVIKLSQGAFRNTGLQELYIFDNIKVISDKTFESCAGLAKVFINAYGKPRITPYLFSEYNFADKYDILILNKDKKKVVVFGGSGAYFSLNAKQMQQELNDSGEDYVCINMAVNGWFNGPAQFEMIGRYLNEGDIFIHAPETSSCFSFMYSVTMAPYINDFQYNRIRMYSCVETNYDLFSLIDLRTVEDFFDGFQLYNTFRSGAPEAEYTDYLTEIIWYADTIQNDLGYIDDSGSIALPLAADSTREKGEADIVVEYVTDEAANKRLNGFYDEMAARGIKVFFTTAPINLYTLEDRLAGDGDFNRISDGGALYFGRPEGIPDPDYENLDEWVAAFEKAVEEHLHCTVILPLHENLYTTGDFCEPDYHLCDEAKTVYTENMTNGVLKQLSK